MLFLKAVCQCRSQLYRVTHMPIAAHTSQMVLLMPGMLIQRGLKVYYLDILNQRGPNVSENEACCWKQWKGVKFCLRKKRGPPQSILSPIQKNTFLTSVRTVSYASSQEIRGFFWENCPKKPTDIKIHGSPNEMSSFPLVNWTPPYVVSVTF